MTQNPTATWTEDRVRAELPNVLVKIGKIVHQGRTSGRLNSYCTVSVTNSVILPGSPIDKHWHFAWSTVANCLNKQKPLRVE